MFPQIVPFVQSPADGLGGAVQRNREVCHARQRFQKGRTVRRREGIPTDIRPTLCFRLAVQIGNPTKVLWFQRAAGTTLKVPAFVRDSDRAVLGIDEFGCDPSH